MKITDNSVNEKFDNLYNRYSPKIFGFIRQYSETKEEAEEYLINVFCKVHKEIHNVDINDERTIQRIVLSICKPLFISKKHSQRIVAAHE